MHRFGVSSDLSTQTNPRLQPPPIFFVPIRPLDHLVGGGEALTFFGSVVSYVFPVTLPGAAGGVMLLDLGESSLFSCNFSSQAWKYRTLRRLGDALL